MTRKTQILLLGPVNTEMEMYVWSRYPDMLVHNCETGTVQRDSEQSLVSSSLGKSGPWKRDGSTLKQSLNKPVPEEADESRRYVTFSLTNGPEYHVSQIEGYLP